MRQKKLKFVSREMLFEQGVYEHVPKINLDKPIHMEIGSGKGQFICTLAKDNPNIQFIAVEMNMSVCYRILEKKIDMHLDNLIIILANIETLFEEFPRHSVDRIYLNFSDPWPKARHHKRRLTYPRFIKNYLAMLKNDGILQFRTDHLDFFNDSLEYLEPFFKKMNIDRNLKESNYMTEYEEKKRKFGPIYQVIAEVNND